VHLQVHKCGCPTH